MSLLDKPEGVALHDIVLGMTKDYPQAVYFPFKMSSSNFEFSSDEIGKRNKAAIEKVQAKLDVPALNDFITALEQLNSPELAWKVGTLIYWNTSLHMSCTYICSYT